MVLWAYLKRQWKLLLLLVGIAAVFAAVFSLYDLPVEAVGYGAALCVVLGIILFLLGFRRFYTRHRELQRLLDRAEVGMCRRNAYGAVVPDALWERSPFSG